MTNLKRLLLLSILLLLFACESDQDRDKGRAVSGAEKVNEKQTKVKTLPSKITKKASPVTIVEKIDSRNSVF